MLQFDKITSESPLIFFKEYSAQSTPAMTAIKSGDTVILRANTIDVFVEVSYINDLKYHGVVKEIPSDILLKTGEPVIFELENIFSVHSKS
jgi:hypothetical protein